MPFFWCSLYLAFRVRVGGITFSSCRRHVMIGHPFPMTETGWSPWRQTNHTRPAYSRSRCLRHTLLWHFAATRFSPHFHRQASFDPLSPLLLLFVLLFCPYRRFVMSEIQAYAFTPTVCLRHVLPMETERIPGKSKQFHADSL